MTSDTASQIAYLARVLKAPALRDSAERLAAAAREAAGRTRNTSPPAWRPRSPPAAPTARPTGSGPPGSPPARPSRTSTSTTSGR